MGTLESKVADALDHPENEQIVREVFVALDQDGNGTLDRDEYRVFIRLLLGHDTSLLKSEVCAADANDKIVMLVSSFSLLVASQAGRPVRRHSGSGRGEIARSNAERLRRQPRPDLQGTIDDYVQTVFLFRLSHA